MNCLVFDHFQFKLAVIQKVMYELHLFGYEYNDGERFIEYCQQGIYSREDDRILESHIEKARRYFEELEIPLWMADHVYDLIISRDNHIYIELNPLWKEKKQYQNGKDFSIASISKKELAQFTRLRRIVFKDFYDGGYRLVQSLKKMEIEVIDYTQEYGEKKTTLESIRYHNHQPTIRNEKRIHPLITILAFIVIVMSFSTLTIMQYQNEREEIIKQEQKEALESLEKETIGQVVLVYSDYYDCYWLEDLNGQRITEQEFLKVEESYFKNQLLLYNYDGYCFFDVEKKVFDETYTRVEKMPVHQGKNRMKGYLVSKDLSSWQLLTEDKLYNEKVIIEKGATISTGGYERLIACYAVIDEGKEIRIKSIIDIPRTEEDE